MQDYWLEEGFQLMTISEYVARCEATSRESAEEGARAELGRGTTPFWLWLGGRRGGEWRLSLRTQPN